MKYLNHPGRTGILFSESEEEWKEHLKKTVKQGEITITETYYSKENKVVLRAFVGEVQCGCFNNLPGHGYALAVSTAKESSRLNIKKLLKDVSQAHA